MLEIEGLRCFRYESVYFDTPDLAAYHQAATGRQNKFKVRTRTYVDSAECVLEVKTRGGRGETIKERTSYLLSDRERLNDMARKSEALGIRNADQRMADLVLEAVSA